MQDSEFDEDHDAEIDQAIVTRLAENISKRNENVETMATAPKTSGTSAPHEKVREIGFDLSMLEKSPTNIIELENREWNYQLAWDLFMDRDYYLSLLVIEFIKTTLPLSQGDMVQTLNLEIHCCERLGMTNRASRITKEVAELK